MEINKKCFLDHSSLINFNAYNKNHFCNLFKRAVHWNYQSDSNNNYCCGSQINEEYSILPFYVKKFCSRRMWVRIPHGTIFTVIHNVLSLGATLCSLLVFAILTWLWRNYLWTMVDDIIYLKKITRTKSRAQLLANIAKE